MVACKTVNEYHSNQRKLRQFYLEEQAVRAALIQPCRPNPVNTEPLGHADVVKMAKANQRKKAQTKRNPKGRTKKADQKRATNFAQRSKKAALKHSQSVRSDKRKLLYSISSEIKSLIKFSPQHLQQSSKLKTFNIRDTLGDPNLYHRIINPPGLTKQDVFDMWRNKVRKWFRQQQRRKANQ